MKIYPKTYENVFSGDRALKKCDISKVFTDINMDAGEYIEEMKKIIKEYQLQVYDKLIKMVWMFQRFCYNGKNRVKRSGNGNLLDSAFGVFMHHYVGIQSKSLISDYTFSKIIVYFEDFHPGFNARNPFEEKMEFPYKNLTFEYLVLVYQLSERLELLDYAEKNNLRYTEFMDYILNYINCFNDESGKKVYEMMLVRFGAPYVKKMKVK